MTIETSRDVPAVPLSVLSQFAVSTEQDDGGIALEHRWRECNWTAWVTDPTLPGIMKQAAEHANACDGKAAPAPRARPSALTSLWGGAVKTLLDASLPANR